jgi:hypothetical protein
VSEVSGRVVFEAAHTLQRVESQKAQGVGLVECLDRLTGSLAIEGRDRGTAGLRDGGELWSVRARNGETKFKKVGRIFSPRI